MTKLISSLKKLIYSQNTTIITDTNQNKISVDMFNYLTLKKMFFSKGDIEVLDSRENKYLFVKSQHIPKKRVKIPCPY